MVKAIKDQQPLSSLYAHDPSDKEASKRAMYERKRIDQIDSLLKLFIDFGWVDKELSAGEQYVKMRTQINFIASNKEGFIRDYLSKASDLREFMAIHATDMTKARFFLSSIKEIKERKVMLPRDPALIAIIKAFNGLPIKIEKYPISITFDGNCFDVKDIPFERPDELSDTEQWRNAPVLVL